MENNPPTSKEIYERWHKAEAELKDLLKQFLELQQKYNEKKIEVAQYEFMYEQSRLS